MALVGAVLLLGALVGLGGRGPRGGRRALFCALPLLLWLGAGAQVATVILRFGSGRCCRSRWGRGAGEGLLPRPLPPLALLFTWGWAGLYRALGGRDERWLTLGILGAFYLPGLDQPGRDALAPLPMAASRAVGGRSRAGSRAGPERARCTYERGRACGRHCCGQLAVPWGPPWSWPCWPWCCVCCTCASRRGRTSPTTPSSSRSTPRRFLAAWGALGTPEVWPRLREALDHASLQGVLYPLFQSLVYQVAGAWAHPGLLVAQAVLGP